MVKRGSKKRFREFSSYIKHHPNNYYYARTTLAKLKEEGYEFVTVSELFDFLNEEKIINGKIYY